MLDVARRPRNLVLLVLALAFAVLFVVLGRWQWTVAAHDAREEALLRGPRQPVVALDDLVHPHAPFPENGSLRRVDLQGHYEPHRQFLVPDRLLRGQRGYWVLTPLVVQGTGARIPVLRGFVTDPAQAGTPATGTVRLRGSLAPAESPVEADLPAGQLGSVDLASLINQWGGQVYNAFVFRMEQRPSDPAAANPALAAVPAPSPTVSGFDARNLGYALQWWVFAVFALYLWWRSVREDWRDEQATAAAASLPPTSAAPGPSSAPVPPVMKDLHV